MINIEKISEEILEECQDGTSISNIMQKIFDILKQEREEILEKFKEEVINEMQPFSKLKFLDEIIKKIKTEYETNTK